MSGGRWRAEGSGGRGTACEGMERVCTERRDEVTKKQEEPEEL